MSSVTSVKSAHYNQTKALQMIDNALSEYFKRLGLDYDNCFMKYITVEQLDDPTLPIENELGDNCSPNDCVYTSMNNNNTFPIASYLVMPDEQRHVFMFYILQYCWKHNHCPTDEYIRTHLVPKISNCFIFEDLISYLEQVNGLIETENGFHDNETDNKDDFWMDLNELIESQLQYSINEWNTKSKKSQKRIKRHYIHFKQVKELFIMYNINYSYFQIKNNRREFMNLLKNKLGVPKAASTRIWKDIQMFVFMDYQQEYDTSFIIDLQEIQCKDF